MSKEFLAHHPPFFCTSRVYTREHRSSQLFTAVVRPCLVPSSSLSDNSPKHPQRREASGESCQRKPVVSSIHGAPNTLRRENNTCAQADRGPNHTAGGAVLEGRQGGLRCTGLGSSATRHTQGCLEAAVTPVPQVCDTDYLLT